MIDLITLSAVALSDVGRVREHNEDAVFVDAELGLSILADGMGGYMAGEVASAIAIDVMREHIGRENDANLLAKVDPLTGMTNAAQRIRSAVIEANQRIYGESSKKRDQDGMGTTLTVVLVYGETACVAHVGDSRVYRLRNGQLMQLTRDHSLVQEQIDAGKLTAEEAKSSGYKNLVTRALGIDALTEADLNEFRIAQGDMFLLCSDGLSDMITDPEIEEEMARAIPKADIARNLVELANRAGGRDNVSVCLMQVDRMPAADKAWWKKWQTTKNSVKAEFK